MKTFFGKFIESGLVAAVVMAIAYLLTCFAIAGRLAAYNLPVELIEIGIPDMILTLYEVVMNVWAILPLAILIAIIAHYLKDQILLNIIYSTGVMVGIILFGVLTVHYFDPANWVLVAIIAYIWISHLGKVLLKQKDVKGLRAKWKANTEREMADRVEGSGKDIARKIAIVCLVICALYYTSQAMYEYGEEESLARTSYYVAHDYDDKVVVFESEWRYVLMENDNGVLQPNYQVVRFDELGSLTYEETGTLMMADPR